jgi:hypothetical protein
MVKPVRAGTVLRAGNLNAGAVMIADEIADGGKKLFADTAATIIPRDHERGYSANHRAVWEIGESSALIMPMTSLSDCARRKQLVWPCLEPRSRSRTSTPLDG